jgi:hypothetical protein
VIERVEVVNFLEEPMDEPGLHLTHSGAEVSINLRPFQVVSLRVG